MVRNRLAFATLVCLGLLTAPAVAQTGWTQVGMLSCRLNPEASASSLPGTRQWNAGSPRIDFHRRPMRVRSSLCGDEAS